MSTGRLYYRTDLGSNESEVAACSLQGNKGVDKEKAWVTWSEQVHGDHQQWARQAWPQILTLALSCNLRQIT